MSLVKPVCSAASLDLGEPLLDRVHRRRRKWHVGLAQVGQRIERRLGVARARQRPHQLARLGAHLIGLLAKRAGQQPQQGAPALEGLAHLMHSLGIAQFGVGKARRASAMMERAAAARAVAEAVAFPGCPRHGRFLPRFHDRFMKSGDLCPSHRRFPLLHSPRNARGRPALRILTRGGAAR